MDLFCLDGKVAPITGSSRGIGLANGQAILSAGAKVVISSEDADETREAARRRDATPPRRPGEVQQIAGTAVFLASTAALGFLTEPED